MVGRREWGDLGWSLVWRVIDVGRLGVSVGRGTVVLLWDEGGDVEEIMGIDGQGSVLWGCGVGEGVGCGMECRKEGSGGMGVMCVGWVEWHGEMDAGSGTGGWKVDR